MSQQTWSEWFWGTSSTSTNTSTSTNPTTSTTSKPPYGPYIRTGRGGAGNFTWQSEETSNGDEEAHNPASLAEQAHEAAESDRQDTEQAMRNNTEPPAYVRVGRGYVERKDLQSAVADTDASAKLAPGTSNDVRGAYRGRGGAGNYAAAAEISEKQKALKQEQERLDADLRRNKVLEDVNDKVPLPPEAWLGGSKRSDEL